MTGMNVDKALEMARFARTNGLVANAFSTEDDENSWVVEVFDRHDYPVVCRVEDHVRAVVSEAA